MTGLPQPSTVGNAACYGIEVLRYTVFWLKRFLNDGASSTQNVGKDACYGNNRGIRVYRFLAEMVSE